LKSSFLTDRMLPAIVTASLLCFAVPGFADTWDYFTDVDKMTSKESRRVVVTSDNTLNLDFLTKAQTTMDALPFDMTRAKALT
jgi:SHS2 domain-containing protein